MLHRGSIGGAFRRLIGYLLVFRLLNDPKTRNAMQALLVFGVPGRLVEAGITFLRHFQIGSIAPAHLIV